MSLLGKITGFDDVRRGLALLAVTAAAGGLIAWGALGHAKARRLEARAETLCAAAGSTFAAAPHAPGDRSRPAPGDACLVRVRHLAAFERDALAASNGVLAGAQADQVARTRNDAARAALDQAATRAAHEQMERQDDAVAADDQVGPDWFDALNALGGLRDPAG